VSRAAGEPIVAAEAFSYAYPEATAPALRDVSLGLEAGSFTVLAGASASGKSTLLRALCGLVPHFHGGRASGELRVGGLSVRDHGPGRLAAVCGTVLQDPETQVVMGSVRAELSLPLEHRGDPASAVARAVEETALGLGVAHLLERRTATLSGGELQRVAIAAATAHRPALLLLDEPTSQLDPVAGDELIWLLRRLNEEWGTTVVLSEHRLERCLPAADRVLALDRGAVVCDAAPRDFLAWAAERAPAQATPLARLFSLAGLGPLPASVKEARAQLRGAGLAPTARGEAPTLPGDTSGRPPGPRAPSRAAATGGEPLRAGAGRPPRAGALSAGVGARSRRWRCAASGTSWRTARSRCAASSSPSRPVSGSRSWAATAPARAPCCASARDSPRRRAAGRSVPARWRCCSRTRATT
jgi:energy-coupling factor transport system ATP-binding protein